jgi:hypothetical protein
MNIQLFSSTQANRRSMAVLWLLAITTAMVSGGCTTLSGVRDYITYNDCQNDFVIGWRNRSWASQAWFMRRGQFEGQPYIDHFGAGFRAGYEDVAGGSNGCTPALPPRKYWTWKYQTPEGQGKTAAWYSGYPHGAKAAEEDGAGYYSQIQVSAEMKAEYGLGHEPPYTTPIFMHNPAEWCRQHGEAIGPGINESEYGPAPTESDVNPEPIDGNLQLHDPSAFNRTPAIQSFRPVSYLPPESNFNPPVSAQQQQVSATPTGLDFQRFEMMRQ